MVFSMTPGISRCGCWLHTAATTHAAAHAAAAHTAAAAHAAAAHAAAAHTSSHSSAHDFILHSWLLRGSATALLHGSLSIPMLLDLAGPIGFLLSGIRIIPDPILILVSSNTFVKISLEKTIT
ncbi:hypothetical protein [Kaarinaea lacus]